LGGSLGRPAAVVTLPEGYNPHDEQTYPIIMVLHGYGSTGHYHDFYLGVSARASTFGYIAIVPEGLVDSRGFHYWNADACCDYDVMGGGGGLYYYYHYHYHYYYHYCCWSCCCNYYYYYCCCCYYYY